MENSPLVRAPRFRKPAMRWTPPLVTNRAEYGCPARSASAAPTAESARGATAAAPRDAEASPSDVSARQPERARNAITSAEADARTAGRLMRAVCRNHFLTLEAP